MDEVCRWGGEEFVIFLDVNKSLNISSEEKFPWRPQVSSIDILERVRCQIEKSTFTFRNKGITILVSRRR